MSIVSTIYTYVAACVGVGGEGGGPLCELVDGDEDEDA